MYCNSINEFKVNHLSDATCLTQVSSKVTNMSANYGDHWRNEKRIKQTRPHLTRSVRQVLPPSQRPVERSRPGSPASNQVTITIITIIIVITIIIFTITFTFTTARRGRFDPEEGKASDGGSSLARALYIYIYTYIYIYIHTHNINIYTHICICIWQSITIYEQRCKIIELHEHQYK